MQKSRSLGFTLIELLVVVSIIGLLATIAVTSMRGAMVKAKKVSFQDSVLFIQRSAVMCCNTNGMTLLPESGSPLPGGPICRKSSDYSVVSDIGNYPDSKTLGSITVPSGMDCDNGSFSLDLTVGTSLTGGWGGASCDHNQCTFNP